MTEWASLRHLTYSVCWKTNWIKTNLICRIHWCGQSPASSWCSVWCHQEQETSNMAEDPRANHGEVPGVVCGLAQVPHCQGGPVPVQEHLSAGMTRVCSQVLVCRCLRYLKGRTVTKLWVETEWVLACCLLQLVYFDLFSLFCNGRNGIWIKTKSR